jgi:hypothetical protein
VPLQAVNHKRFEMPRNFSVRTLVLLCHKNLA